MTEKSQKWILNIFFCLVCLAITSPLWVSKEFLFPYVTTKAFVLRIAIELALPCFAILLFLRKALRPNLKNPLNLAVIGLVIVFWVSGLLGVNPHRSLWGNFERMGGAFYFTHLALLYFYILLLSQAGGVYIKRVLKFFLFVAGIICINGVVGWLGGPTLVLDPSLPGRASSTLGNPIYLGAFAILPIFLSLFFAFQAEKQLGKILYAVLGILFFLAMFQSGTRGALVGLLSGIVISSLLYIFLHPSNNVRRNGLIVVVVGGIIFGSLFFKPEVLPEGSAIRRIFQLKDSNTSARVIQWQSALRGVKDFPILGVGLENYYIVSNKYYNSELYKYDRSWFDKPHNYLLEVLSTTGVIGLGFYLAILVGVILGLYKAFKGNFLSLKEVCVLFAGFTAYQIQNLFVFDTVPTSVSFYVFLGFVGYLFFEMENVKKIKKKEHKTYFSVPLSLAVLIVVVPISIYAIWFLNILPMQAGKNVNYGYAYISADPVKAGEYFEKVSQNKFNLDIPESASKRTEYVGNLFALVNRTDKKQMAFVLHEASKALEYQKIATVFSPNDPVVLQRLAGLEFQLAIMRNLLSGINDTVENLNQAIALAPNRVEARTMLAQVRLTQGYNNEALALLKKNIELDRSYGLNHWQLALVLRQVGQIAESISVSLEAIRLGHKPRQITEVKWVIDELVKSGNSKGAVEIYEIVKQQGGLTLVDMQALKQLYEQLDLKDKADKLSAEIKAMEVKTKK